MLPETATSELPLSGIRVVEYGHAGAGPYCARLLADAGAEVIKVEDPEGDEARRRGPFPDDLPNPNRSGLFHYLNFNKLGITLNLSDATGQRLLGQLLEQADIFVENNPPQVMEEWELQFPALHAMNPRLIVTSITPFGQTGPYRDYRADDLILANMGGLTYATPGLPDATEAGPQKPPLRPATPIADFTAGITGAVATLFALFSREMDGLGRHVDLSQQATMASMMTWDISTYSYLGILPGRNSPLGSGPMPNVYVPCKDGYVAIVAFSDYHWPKLVHLMGDPEWAQESLFDTGDLRAQYWDAILPHLLEWTMAHTRQEIFEMTQAQGLPCFPAFEVGEAVSSAHVMERGSLKEVALGNDRRAKIPDLPFSFSELSRRPLMPAPDLGEHTTKVLSERLGYDPQALVRFKSLEVL